MKMPMVLTLSTISWLAVASAQDGDAWGYPEDIPEVAPASVGLAGSEPANVARFFKVLGQGGGQVSPDGETVIFSNSSSGNRQVYAVPADGGQARQLTFGTGGSGYRFAPDGRILIQADTDGDERLGFTLLSVDGRDETRLLKASDAFNSFGDFDEDMSRIVYSTTGRNGRDFDVYVAPIGSGEPEEVFRGELGFYVQDFRPGTDQVIVRETRGSEGGIVHLLDVGTGELKTLFDPEEISGFGDFTFSADGDTLFMLTDLNREFSAIAEVDMAAIDTGTSPQEALEMIHGHDDRDVENVELVADRYLVFSENENGYSKLGAIDLNRGGREVELPELPPGIYGLSASEDAAKVAVTIRGPQSPGTVGLIDMTGRRPTFEVLQGPIDAGLPVETFQAPRSVRFDARDGVELQALVYDAQGAEGDAPVVITVHGGPAAQARPSFDPLAEYLTSRGIAVVDLNFRGSTGFGKTFESLDDKRNRTKSVDDVADAVAWIQETEGLDGDRVAVMGGSYGGYLVNAVTGDYPDLFKAGVSLVGVSDWVRALEEASPGLKAADILEYGDIDDPEDRAFHASISPINNVDKIQAAMLFSHGANDPRDPVTESDRMVKALRDRGVEVTYLRWPDEGHSVRKLNNRVHLYQEIAAFLEAELAGE